MSSRDATGALDEERAVAELLSHIARATDAREAFSFALAGALSSLEEEHGAVMLRRAGGWEISRGPSLDPPVRDPRDFTRLGDIPIELEGVLKGPEPAALPEEHATLVDFSPCVSLPFADAEDRPLGALLVPGRASTPAISTLASVVRRCGPALARAQWLDALREEAAVLDRRNLLLTRLQDALADPVVIADANNDILFANRRANALLGSREGDTVGRSQAIRTNTFLFSAFLTQERMSEGGSAGRELSLVDPSDGSDLLFEVLISRLPVDVQPDDLQLCVLRDITDLKRALYELELEYRRSRGAEHHALRESQRLNAIIHNAADPILVTDGDSRIVLMNPEAERLFEPRESSDEAARAIPLWTNVTRFTSLVSEFLLMPEARLEAHLTLTDPETSRDLPLRAANAKIMSTLDEPAAVVTVLRDLTGELENERLAHELGKLNDELEERIAVATRELAARNEMLEWQRSELEHASQLKSEFLARMSHELRTPINAILGYSSLLRERLYGELTPEQETALERVDAASEHLLALINDVLDLAKIEAGKMPVRPRAVRFEEIVTVISETIRPLVDRKGLEFRVQVAERVPTIRTDPTKLRQVLLNLLENAVKFTNEGWVALRAAPDGAWLRIEVEDSGIGIEESQLEVIFEDFRQSHDFSTREYEGTGLGLSISRKLLGLMGGSIHVESTVGVGTRFAVQLPLESRDTAPEAARDDDGASLSAASRLAE